MHVGVDEKSGLVRMAELTRTLVCGPDGSGYPSINQCTQASKGVHKRRIGIRNSEAHAGTPAWSIPVA